VIAYKLADKGWSWAVGPSAVLQIYDHTTLVAEVPVGFVTDLVTQRLRDVALSRKLASLVAEEPIDKLMRELDPPRRVAMEPLPDLRPLAPRLRAARRAAGLTTKALAEKAAISTTYLRNLETGVGDPSPAVARRLADALGLDVTDLFPTPAARRAEEA